MFLFSCSHRPYTGSGFCALAFVNQIIENEKEKQEKSKIVVLERGNMLLPTHFQNLPPVFAATLPNQVVMTGNPLLPKVLSV